MNRIFLLRGYRGSGKDMLAEFLEKEYKFGRTSFANPLKDETCRQYSLSRNMGDDQS